MIFFRRPSRTGSPAALSASILTAGLTIALAAASVCEATEVEIMRAPNGGIQPQLAVGKAGKLHLIYFKGGKQEGDVFYVTRESGADSEAWSEPVRVNSEPGGARRNGAISHARLAVDDSGRAHVTWFTMRPPNYFYARMSDDGRGFELQRSLVKKNIHGVEAGAALVTTGSNKVSLIWHAGPFAQVESRGIFIMESTDGGKTFGGERQIDSAKAGSCPCCGLSAIGGGDGRLLVSYRSAVEKIHRDMTLLDSKDGGKSFSGATLHKWDIPRCPVATTAFAAGPGGNVAVAWETKGQVYFAPIDDPDKTVAPPSVSYGQVRRKNPSIAVNAKGETLLAWGEGEGFRAGGKLHWATFDKSGKPTGQKGQPGEIPESSMPAAAVLPNGSFLVIY